MLGRRNRLETILGTFNKVVNDLDILVRDNSNRLKTNDVKIANLRVENDDLGSENEKALAVRAKIAALVE